MMLFGRKLDRYTLWLVPKYLWYFARVFILFKRPWQVIWAYLRACSPPGNVVELRNGLRILLSDHPHDIITVFVIFVRRDYGTVAANGVAVDVGANIGVFSLFAAHAGARRVIAYEPNSKAYEMLQRNIRENNLQEIIIPRHEAVASKSGEEVWIPTDASAYNSISTDPTQGAERVLTTSLAGIVDEVTQIDLLKLDCEGSEYDILLNSSSDLLSHVGTIRMEYHDGRLDEVEAVLVPLGFQKKHWQQDSPRLGNVWYSRKSPLEG